MHGPQNEVREVICPSKYYISTPDCHCIPSSTERCSIYCSVPQRTTPQIHSQVREKRNRYFPLSNNYRTTIMVSTIEYMGIIMPVIESSITIVFAFGCRL